MNPLFLFLVAAIGSIATPTQKPGTAEMVDFTITFQVLNTIPGYSYDTRMDVYVDGNKIGQSPVKDQQEVNTFTVKVPTGQHTLKCILLANYKGKWEERTVANTYSYDFIWNKTQNFTKKQKVKLYFDVDSGVHENKKPKKSKNK